jgi:hypothetical protein
MENRTFIVKGENLLEPVTALVRQYYQQAYESSYKGGFVRYFEDYSLMNSNDLMVSLRIDTNEAEKGIVTIEIVVGGSRDNIIFDLTFGSEGRRIKRFREKLEEFCKEHKFSMEIKSES